MSMNPLMFPITDSLREALDKAATERKVSRAALIRIAIAAYIDFDLGAQPSSGRPSKYADKEARKEAQRALAKARRQATNRLIAMVQAGEREEDIKALARSIEKGIYE